MSVDIVDAFEVIDINDYYGEPAPFANRARPFRGEPLIETTPIAYLGQGIGIGYLKERFHRGVEIALRDRGRPVISAHDDRSIKDI